MSRHLAILPLFVALSIAARAEEPHTITVRGRGTVSARPDTLVMTFDASGKAEKAADAIAKLRAKSDTLRTSLNDALKEKGQLNASIADTGLAWGGAGGAGEAQVFLGAMGGNREAAAETTVSTQLKVTVPGVDKMPSEELALLVSTLLDKGTDAGSGETAAGANAATVWITRAYGGGGGGPVQFTFSDPDAAVEKAWDEAIARARKRAEMIASKLGLTIGDAVRVRDAAAGPSPESPSNPYAVAMAMFSAAGGGKTTSSGEVELSAEVEVEFELKKK
ncbi:MAG: SIMPL domain-containing protein [Planctomycetes bacterium]|nr:SIMPL domain-containing protein [Planctomycetota bacterium]